MQAPTNDGVSLTGPFAGLVLAAVLFGFTIVQAWQYYTRFPKDSVIIKSKVAFVCILDLLHFVFTISLVHTLFISSLESEVSIKSFWSLKAMIMIQTISTVSVHFIYLQRIHTFSKTPQLNEATSSKIINVVILFIAFCATGVAAVFIYGVQKTEGVMASKITQGPRWAVIIALWATVAIDVCITALTCFVLHQNRMEMGLDYISKWSNRLLLDLFKYSVASGLLTSIAATLVVVMYLARPNTLDYLSICLTITKLYTNSLLSLIQYVRRQISRNPTDTKESNMRSVIVFRGVSKRSGWTITNPNVSRNDKTFPSVVGFDLEHNPEPQYMENNKRLEVSDVFSPYEGFYQAREGVRHNLWRQEPEIIDAGSWISFRRTPVRAWLSWPIERRSSL